MACMANITSQKAGFLGSQYQQMLGLQAGLAPLNPPQGALSLEPRWGLTQPPEPRRDWLPPIIYKLPASTKENKNPGAWKNNVNAGVFCRELVVLPGAYAFEVVTHVMYYMCTYTSTYRQFISMFYLWEFHTKQDFVFKDDPAIYIIYNAYFEIFQSWEFYRSRPLPETSKAFTLAVFLLGACRLSASHGYPCPARKLRVPGAKNECSIKYKTLHYLCENWSFPWFGTFPTAKIVWELFSWPVVVAMDVFFVSQCGGGLSFRSFLCLLFAYFAVTVVCLFVLQCAVVLLGVLC